MRNELDVLNKNIVVPGCDFSRVALTFAEVNEETLLRAGACLQEMANCEDWWWGDYLVAFAEWSLSEGGDESLQDDEKEKLRRHYVRNHPSVLNGRELAETQVERYKCAGFYNCGSRLPQLSNEHHRQAMDGSGGDVAVAQAWLDKAAQHDWSMRELRAQMKSAKRAEGDTSPKHETITQTELFAAKRWAKAQLNRVEDMELAEMARMLRDLEPLLNLARSLAERLAPTKESLQRAS